MSDVCASDLDDAEILENVTRNLNDYFHLILGKYERSVLAVAMGILNNPQDAEEVTADTFVKFYQSLPAMIAEERDIHLRPLLMRIVTNRCLNRRRDEQRQLRFLPGGRISLDTVEGRVFVEGMPCGQTISAEGEAIQHENSEELYRLLGRLTLRERVVVTNHYIGKLPDSEIASMLDEKKPDTIKKMRQRALKKLRDMRSKEMSGMTGMTAVL